VELKDAGHVLSTHIMLLHNHPSQVTKAFSPAKREREREREDIIEEKLHECFGHFTAWNECVLSKFSKILQNQKPCLWFGGGEGLSLSCPSHQGKY
jgi:hypothetical protein